MLKTPETLWYAADVDPATRLARLALLPFSLLYGAGASAHRLVYDAGLLRRVRAPIPIVAVGNVVAGGAGKTPVVLALVERTKALGIRCAVLSRGYGARARGVRVEPDMSARECGDEPLLIQRRTGVPVYVGPDRAALSRRAADEGAALAFLDDGMQHHRLHRDRLIGVMRMPRPLGNGLMLPAGPLREPAAQLGRADEVIVLGNGDEPTELPAQRTIQARLVPTALVDVATSRSRPISELRDSRIVAAAGIARPSAFFRTLLDAGAVIAHRHAAGDHGELPVAELVRAAQRTNAGALVITEKDAVKLPARARHDVPVFALRVTLEFPRDGEAARLDSMLASLVP